MEVPVSGVNFTRQDIEKKSFLIVDDFADMRNMLKGMLQLIGVAEIDSAANGKDAVSAMEQRRYDIVLCDYNLGPAKNGQQVLEEARHRDLIGLGSIFVMITAENTRDMVMGAVEYEPDSYLTKPFTKDLLKARLDKLIARKKDLEDVDRAVRQRSLVEAIRLLDAKISEGSKNLSELQRLKAELCYRVGEYQQAEAIYQQVLSVREMPWARLGLGKVLFSSKRYPEARLLFEALLQENERLTAAYDWLARTLRMLEQSQEAQKILQRAVELSPKAILRQKALADLALENQDDETAERALDQAVRLGRHSVYRHPSLHARLAKTKSRNGSNSAGLKVLKNMRQEFGADQEAELYCCMAEGVIQQDLGNAAAAAASLEKAALLYQKLDLHANPEATLEMAQTCGQMGDPQRAEELIRELVRNNHSEEQFLRQVGGVMRGLGLQADPENFIAEIKREIVHLNNRGVELAREGKLKEAVGLFEEAVEGMPGNRVVNLNTARVLIIFMQRHGVEPARLGKARQYLERVRLMEPENPALRKVDEMYRELASQSAEASGSA